MASSSSIRAVSGGATLLACVLLFASPSISAPFVLELPELIGTWGDRLDPTATLNLPASFDFGREFQSIESVALELDATVFAHEYDFCGFTFDPQPCTPRTQQWGFFSVLDDEGTSPLTAFAGVSIGDPYAPVVTGTGRGNFDNYPFHSSFEFLLDGKGDLSVGWNRILFFDSIVDTHLFPSTEITGARLIIEATPVPEPATFELAAVGIFLVAAARRRARR